MPERKKSSCVGDRRRRDVATLLLLVYCGDPQEEHPRTFLPPLYCLTSGEKAGPVRSVRFPMNRLSPVDCTVPTVLATPVRFCATVQLPSRTVAPLTRFTPVPLPATSVSVRLLSEPLTVPSPVLLADRFDPSTLTRLLAPADIPVPDCFTVVLRITTPSPVVAVKLMPVVPMLLILVSSITTVGLVVVLLTSMPVVEKPKI